MVWKIYDLSNPSDPDNVRDLFKDDDREDTSVYEDLGEESDTVSQDEMKECGGDSETEQDDEEATDEYEPHPGVNCFI